MPMMTLPVQAPPVARGYLRAYEAPSMHQQGCNWGLCGTTIATCALACLMGPGPCMSCVGPLWGMCKDCFD